jgi:hypothetical protein
MTPTIGVISVASPCKQRWEEMKGDDNVRFCGVCSKNVYQLDNLSVDEVRDLVIAKEGKMCWRFFVRRDGTVLTRDCPVGLRRVRQRMVAAIAMAAALVMSSAALLLRGAGFWGASQTVGSCAVRLHDATQAIDPIKAVGGVGERLMGKKMGGISASELK